MNKIVCLAMLLALALTVSNAYSFAANETSSAASHNGSESHSNSNSTGCAQYTKCGDCMNDKVCVWCEGASMCTDGTFYGSKPLNTCKDFQWMQCKIQGRWAMAIAGGIIGFILFFFICLICCCCCCKKKNSHKYYHIQDEERHSLVGSRTPVTDSRREEMRKKWGVGANSRSSSSNSWN
ncbi:hypothetical protein CYY_009320 [Polysphondylium violaceum]|uniref:PSI domain-containing protein n=1 Tax=Polysphondylium violaceum TaxID=133409 RepID=A0A8J4UW91_9MYCE|nr:hypothetical protein CYY_009320 [Polysphondylium violaceum]